MPPRSLSDLSFRTRRLSYPTALSISRRSARRRPSVSSEDIISFVVVVVVVVVKSDFEYISRSSESSFLKKDFLRSDGFFFFFQKLFRVLHNILDILKLQMITIRRSYHEKPTLPISTAHLSLVGRQ